MIDYFINCNYVIQALIATIFTWGITALGASLVFLFKKVKKSVMDAMLGLSSGVMIAASFWSLLSPAIEMSNNLKMNSWLVTLIGFLGGGILLYVGDKIFSLIEKKVKKNKNNKDNTESSNLKRSLMLVFSITLHNIPEGI